MPRSLHVASLHAEYNMNVVKFVKMKPHEVGFARCMGVFGGMRCQQQSALEVPPSPTSSLAND
jgi:hypothetical protein